MKDQETTCGCCMARAPEQTMAKVRVPKKTSVQLWLCRACADLWMQSPEAARGNQRDLDDFVRRRQAEVRVAKMKEAGW